MSVKTNPERFSLDPKEYFPRVGDIVLLSQYKIEWEVLHASYDQSRLYLRSVLGKRPAQVVSNAVTAIWRDSSIKPPRDNTADYGDIWADAEYDWSDDDED